MKRTVLPLLLLLLLLVGAACTSRPAPEWLSAGHRHLEIYKEDVLSGRNEDLAEIHFQRALAEIRRSGDAALPAPYRPLVKALKRGDSAEAERAIRQIAPPLSRLIASGVTRGQQIHSEAILQNAVETAAQEGWQRPLLAWLKALKGHYEATGERDKAAAVEGRIGLIER